MSALLSRVHVYGPISRAALTAELGLNRSTIGDLTGQLEALGLVRGGGPEHHAALGAPIARRPAAAGRHGAGRRDRRRLDRRRAGRPRWRGHRPAAAYPPAGQPRRTPGRRERRPDGPGAARAARGRSLPRRRGLRARRGTAHPTAWCGSHPTSAGTTSRSPALLSDELGMPVDSGNDADLGGLAEHTRGRCRRRQRRRVPQLPRRASAAASSSAGRPCAAPTGTPARSATCRSTATASAAAAGRSGAGRRRSARTTCSPLAGRLPGGGAGAVDEVIAAAAAGDRRSPGGRRLGGRVDRRRACVPS